MRPITVAEQLEEDWGLAIAVFERLSQQCQQMDPDQALLHKMKISAISKELEYFIRPFLEDSDPTHPINGPDTG